MPCCRALKMRCKSPGAAILTRDKLFGGEGRQQSHPVTRTHVVTGTGTQRIQEMERHSEMSRWTVGATHFPGPGQGGWSSEPEASLGNVSSSTVP